MRSLSQVKHLTTITRTVTACGTPSACRGPGAVGSRAAQLAHQVRKSLISSLSRAEVRLFYAQHSLGEDLRGPASLRKRPNGCFKRRTRQAQKTEQASNAPSPLTPGHPDTPTRNQISYQ